MAQDWPSAPATRVRYEVILLAYMRKGASKAALQSDADTAIDHSTIPKKNDTLLL